jgi:phosphoserine aminotransferase
MSNKIYFTPGPSQLFYSFNDHYKKALFLDIPSISHRSTDFVKVVTHTKKCLKELLNIPEGYDIFFLNSANESWDRIIQNLVVNSSHHFANGAFSKKFYDFAIQQGMSSTVHEVKPGKSFTDFSIPNETELIGLTKNETSTGYVLSEIEIEKIRKENPEKLIALDIVSAIPSIPVNFNNVDTVYFSVQKGFGMPPGLGVWICNLKCQEKAAKKSKITSIGSYRSLPNLKKFSDKNQTPETPNTLFIYLLGKIAEDMIQVGKQKIINDTIYKSTLLYQAIEDNPILSPFIKEKEHRSKTTIVAETRKSMAFINILKEKGMVIGDGYGSFNGQHIRVANFPTHSKEAIEMLCDYLVEIE